MTALLVTLGVLVAGTPAFLGFFYGAGISAFSVITLSRLSSMLVTAVPQRPRGIRMTVLLLILKLPVFLVSVYFATQLPFVGVLFFLTGVAVVYSLTVWFLACSPNRA